MANREPAGLAAEDRDELLVDDLDDLLGRVQRLADLVAEGALAHAGGELLDDRQRDVGVEQGEADLADGAVDVRGGQPALAAQVLEGLGEAVGEISEGGHGGTS